MEFETTKDVLKNPITFAEKPTGKNRTLPVLSSIILTTKKQSLTIQATNLDIGVEFTIPVKVIKEGSIAVPGVLLSSVIGNIQTSKKITCSTKQGIFNIITNGDTITLNTTPQEDFPMIPVVQEGDMFTTQSKKFISGLKSVVYAASLSDIKPEFSGVYVYPQQQNLVFVATDTYRLAEKKIPEKSSSSFPGIIIPHKNITEILRIFEGVDDDIAVVSNKNQISFSTETIHISSRAINTPFPNYQEIFPKTYTTEATILKQDLIDILKITNNFSDKSGRVTFTINPKIKQCFIAAQNQTTGEQVSTVDAVLSGEDASHDYNYRYILECLQYVPHASIICKVSSDGKLVITGLGDPSFTYLVAPLMKQG